MIARVAIVDDSAMSPSEKLAAALERAGFWEVMAASRGDARIVIKPDMVISINGAKWKIEQKSTFRDIAWEFELNQEFLVFFFQSF